MSDIQSKYVANPVANSDHEPDANIENDVCVPDIQPDSTNEQESDGNELILEKKVANSLLDVLPVEILEKVFLDAKLSEFSFPGHVCWIFNHTTAAIARLERFRQRTIEFLPTICFSNITNLPKPRPKIQIDLDLQRIIRAYGSMSATVFELNRVMQNTGWSFSWLVLVTESFRWFLIMDVYWKRRKH